MLRIVVLLVGLLAVVSCGDDALPEGEFAVIVESTSDISCRLPVIRFLGNGKQVKQRTTYETLVYNAYHLDSTFNTVGTKLIIRFSQVSPEDLRPCLAIGTWYPGIAILEARLAE